MLRRLRRNSRSWISKLKPQKSYHSLNRTKIAEMFDSTPRSGYIGMSQWFIFPEEWSRCCASSH
jgi:hypothetical protein